MFIFLLLFLLYSLAFSYNYYACSCAFDNSCLSRKHLFSCFIFSKWHSWVIRLWKQSWFLGNKMEQVGKVETVKQNCCMSLGGIMILAGGGVRKHHVIRENYSNRIQKSITSCIFVHCQHYHFQKYITTLTVRSI